MSVPRKRTQRSFFDVAFLVEDLFKPDDRYRLFREQVLPALCQARETLAGLYCEANGRPAIEPVVMAGVTLLQFMEKVSDRRAVELVRMHLGWKFAMDLEVTYEGFHATSLVSFRERLLEGQAERVVLDAVLDRLRQAGLVRKRSKQRLDSTHVLGWVSAMSRLEVVRETLRLALGAMDRVGAAPDWADWGVVKERYRGAPSDWRHVSREELRRRFEQAGVDAARLIAWEGPGSDAWRETEAAGVLQRVFVEQYEAVDGVVKGRSKESSGTVQNPHDPDAQWATKNAKDKRGWVGYKAQVVETVPETAGPKPAGEPTDQFVTEVTTTEAIASDLDGMERALTAQESHGQERPSELFVDAAYVSDDTLAESAERGTELVGPARPCPTHKGGLSVERFDVDVSNRRAVCPAGKTSTQCSFIHDSHQGNAYYRFEWGAACDACALRGSCTTSKSGRRSVCVGEHHDRLQARRREMKTEAFRKRMHQRNAIEGTISELTRLGLRRTRYRGLAKTTLANDVLAAACNVRRWLRLLAWRQQNAPALASA